MFPIEFYLVLFILVVPLSYLVFYIEGQNEYYDEIQHLSTKADYKDALAKYMKKKYNMDISQYKIHPAKQIKRKTLYFLVENKVKYKMHAYVTKDDTGAFEINIEFDN